MLACEKRRCLYVTLAWTQDDLYLYMPHLLQNVLLPSISLSQTAYGQSVIYICVFTHICIYINISIVLGVGRDCFLEFCCAHVFSTHIFSLTPVLPKKGTFASCIESKLVGLRKVGDTSRLIVLFSKQNLHQHSSYSSEDSWGGSGTQDGPVDVI